MAGYELKTALSKLGTKRMNFALYRGADSDHVLVTPLAPSGTVIKEMEKETGPAKRLFKGVAYYDGSQLVFASKEAAPAHEKAIIAVFKEKKCATFLPVQFRELPKGESDEVAAEEGAPAPAGATPAPGVAPGSDVPPAPVPPRDAGAPAPAPAADPAKAEWDALKAALFPRIKTALANPALKDAVAKLAGEAVGHEKAGAFAAATGVLQKLAPLLGVAPAPSAPPPPAPTATVPVPPPAPAPPNGPAVPPNAPVGPSAASLQAALNKLSPLISQAVAANPAVKESLLRPVVNFQSALKANDIPAAQASLGALATALKAARAAGEAPSTGAPIPAAPEAPASGQEPQSEQNQEIPAPPPTPQNQEDSAPPEPQNAGNEQIPPPQDGGQDIPAAPPAPDAEVPQAPPNQESEIPEAPPLTSEEIPVAPPLASEEPAPAPPEVPNAETTDIPAPPPAPGDAPQREEAEFLELLEEMQQPYLDAVHTDGQSGPEYEGLITRLNFFWNKIADHQSSGDFAAGLKALNELKAGNLFADIERAKASGSGPIEAGTVEKRKFLVTRFQQIPAALRAELGKLRAQIEKNYPDEDAADLTDAMDANLTLLVEELQEEIDSAITAGDMGLLKGLKARVTGDELISHLINNPFVNGTPFKSLVLEALDEVETKLTAA